MQIYKILIEISGKITGPSSKDHMGLQIPNVCTRFHIYSWKEVMEEKGLRVNAGKTKIMICGTGLDLLQSSGKFPSTVCRTEVGAAASSAKAVSNGCIRIAVGSSP